MTDDIPTTSDISDQVSDHLDRNPDDARDFTPPNVAALEQWVRELRTGIYHQGRNSLAKYRDHVPRRLSEILSATPPHASVAPDMHLHDLAEAGLVEFCCIGVAGVLFRAEFVQAEGSRCWAAPVKDGAMHGDSGYSASGTYVTEVMEHTGLTEDDMTALTFLNDAERVNFNGIATVLEYAAEWGVGVHAAAELAGVVEEYAGGRMGGDLS